MTYPRFRRSRDHKKVVKTGGSYTLNNTGWTAVDTAMDLVLAARVGDDIEVMLDYVIGNTTPDVWLDVGTVVSGSVVNRASGASAQGPAGWGNAASVEKRASVRYIFTVVSGDLASGTVTLRLLYKSASATNRTLYAVTDNPLVFAVKNLGPPDPN